MRTLTMTVPTPTVSASLGTLLRSLSKKRALATMVSYARVLQESGRHRDMLPRTRNGTGPALSPLLQFPLILCRTTIVIKLNSRSGDMKPKSLLKPKYASALSHALSLALPLGTSRTRVRDTSDDPGSLNA